MAQFNTAATKARNGSGVIKTTDVRALTAEGGLGFARAEKSELFLAAISDFMGDTFYENRSNRDDRTQKLVAKVAVEDPEWIQKFAQWLRTDGNMRSISLMVALEAADAMIKAGITGSRKVVSSVLTRADEPGEALGYWMSKKGRKLPAAVKRGIADAAVSTYNQYSLPKYDSDSKAFKFADVIRLTHPKPRDVAQESLFKYAIEKRIDSNAEADVWLNKIGLRDELMSRDNDALLKLIESESGQKLIQDAGLTWEAVSGKIGLSARVWEALIPNMGYMALLRNLRNFRQYGVSDKTYQSVLNKLSDPEQVAKSRQFPFRFLSAYYANQDHLPTAATLEVALNHSLSNVPSLKGHTLILVDRSASMFPYNYGRESELSYADKAALFGIALALRAEKATLVQFGTSSKEVKFKKGDSILPLLKRFENMGGTDTVTAFRKNFAGHDRVVNLTDEQYYGGWGNTRTPGSQIPATTPLYTFNLAGYATAQDKADYNRVTFGGLTDQCFGLIPVLEQGRDEKWPWMV